MKNKLVLLCLIITVSVNVMNVNATSGMLVEKSIKTCSDGKMYGYHGQNKHWHEANIPQGSEEVIIPR